MILNKKKYRINILVIYIKIINTNISTLGENMARLVSNKIVSFANALRTAILIDKYEAL